MPDAIQSRSPELGAYAEDREALVARLRAHADEIRERGIVSLSIFGSRARGEERPDSDLDVLIAYDSQRPFTLYDLVRTERFLEDLTGLEVQVSTRDGFPPQQLGRVLKEAVSVL
jgi:predicted nucleotidyltransferase